MKKLLVLVGCLAFVGIMLYQTGFFSYIQGGHSMISSAKIEVELEEYSRNSAGDRLQPYSAVSVLRPEENAYTGSQYLQQFETYRWPGDRDYTVQFWTADMPRAIDKIVTAANRGNIPVYVRTVFAFEQLDSILWKNVCCDGSTSGLIQHGQITIHGDKFELYSYTYDAPLQPGKRTLPSLLQIAMDANATNRDMQIVANGYEIMLTTQACQATGLPDELTSGATAAHVLNTLLGQITTEQHPWIGQ